MFGDVLYVGADVNVDYVDVVVGGGGLFVVDDCYDVAAATGVTAAVEATHITITT